MKRQSLESTRISLTEKLVAWTLRDHSVNAAPRTVPEWPQRGEGMSVHWERTGSHIEKGVYPKEFVLYLEDSVLYLEDVCTLEGFLSGG